MNNRTVAFVMFLIAATLTAIMVSTVSLETHTLARGLAFGSMVTGILFFAAGALFERGVTEKREPALLASENVVAKTRIVGKDGQPYDYEVRLPPPPAKEKL